MDDRTREIREGAGLVESRLNTAFIDWLRKWSTPILIVAAVALLGYMGWQKLQAARITRVNTAFSELAAASEGSNPSPDSLRRVADEFDGVRAVGHLARLSAADIYLEAVRRGIKVGRATTSEPLPEDLLTPEERDMYLREAEGLYEVVLAKAGGDADMAIHAAGAAFGLAAIEECRGATDAARSRYEAAKAIAEKAGMTVHARIAEERIADLPTLPEATLPTEAELEGASAEP